MDKPQSEIPFILVIQKTSIQANSGPVRQELQKRPLQPGRVLEGWRVA